MLSSLIQVYAWMSRHNYYKKKQQKFVLKNNLCTTDKDTQNSKTVQKNKDDQHKQGWMRL